MRIAVLIYLVAILDPLTIARSVHADGKVRVRA
jgi:hypothetical protein